MKFAPHPFTLRQLQYLVAVAETRSFRAAAEQCHVAQPSLSAQIAQLEDSLGVTLFERERRPVLVTPSGKALIARARALLREADDLVSAARSLQDPLAGTLRLGVIPTISPYLLPEAAEALRRELPKLELVFVEEKTHVLVSKIEHGELDAALLALEADLNGLETTRMVRDPFVLAVPRTHRLAKRKQAVKVNELAGEQVLLLDDGHCFRAQALAYCARAKVEEVGFRATSLATLTQMVAGGFGVTLLPTLAVPIENRRGDLAILPLSSPEPARTIGLAYRPGSPLKPRLERVADVIAAAAAPLLMAGNKAQARRERGAAKVEAAR
jgi:LysR family hydrogen peroxide-inducible transcriptional activator